MDFLLLRRKEVVHSNAIAGLLDPRGIHDQGPLFLKQFLRWCNQKPEFPDVLASMSSWLSSFIVRRESRIHGQRRPDLILRARGHFCFVIENKIHSPEGEAQLPDYAKWLRACAEPAKALIFLTPNGRQSTQSGISRDEYFCFSYRKDARGWLINCLDQIRAASVRAFVAAYLRTISALGGTFDDEDQET